MTPQISTPETLRIGHSTRTKIAIGGTAGLGWLLTYSMLTVGGAPVLAFLPGLIGLVATVLLVGTLRNGYAMHPGGLQHITWLGRRSYSRSAFLGAERVEDRRGKPGLLLRFQHGVVMLADSTGCSDPEEVHAYLEEHWQVRADAPRGDTAGPVAEHLVMEYETLHLVWLGLCTVVLAGLSAFGPMFWVCAGMAFFTGRAFHRIYSCQRITTSHEGLTVSRPLQPEVKVRWDRVSSVRYWYSLTHGGMLLSDGKTTVRVYRWIQNYPRFNRLVQDNVAATSFSPAPALPWSISLNHGRRSNLAVLLIAAGVSAWLFSQGAWPAALLFVAIPAATFAFAAIANSRQLVVEADRVRVIEKRSFRTSVREYPRTDLQDMRIGRQLTAGGLWLKFGSERIEIANLDSSVPPEEILLALRREWQSERTLLAEDEPVEFRAA